MQKTPPGAHASKARSGLRESIEAPHPDRIRRRARLAQNTVTRADSDCMHRCSPQTTQPGGVHRRASGVRDESGRFGRLSTDRGATTNAGDAGPSGCLVWQGTPPATRPTCWRSPAASWWLASPRGVGANAMREWRGHGDDAGRLPVRRACAAFTGGPPSVAVYLPGTRFVYFSAGRQSRDTSPAFA